MRMGTAQKQNIAIQHRYFNKHSNPQRPTPISFKEWLLQGMKRYHDEQGFTFELVTPSLMRIKRPGQTNLLRTAADFERISRGISLKILNFLSFPKTSYVTLRFRTDKRLIDDREKEKTGAEWRSSQANMPET